MRNGRPYFRADSRDPRKQVATEKHHCLTPHCRGVVNKKSEHSPYCTHCRLVRWRNKNPLRYSFGNLRRRAKQRGKEFQLTFEQYREFAQKTNYAEMKGKTSLSISIDRIENALGYFFWNIAAVRLSQNARKSFVPYFNGGVMPELDKAEYLELERKYSEPLKQIAAEVGERRGFGTAAFWKEFQNKKAELYQNEN